MIPWRTLAEAKAPDGGTLVLRERGNELVISVDGQTLMTSRTHGSEEELARLGCEHLATTEAPVVLIGGLGMGYTLRATLDRLPANGRVVVAELVTDVVTWNRGPLAHLAGNPLDDPRVEVAIGDVLAIAGAASARFDAALLDIDNGPMPLTREANTGVYAPAGLKTFRRALRPGGVLAIWSAGRVPTFDERLQRAGFEARSVDAAARTGKRGTTHAILLGRAPAGRTQAPRRG